jgi:hypothetical protein
LNTTQKSLFSGAWKNAVAAVSGVVIANSVDSPSPIMSLLWFKHIGIQSLFVLLVTEARYWNQWANSGTEQPLPQAIGVAQDAAKKTEAAIADVKAAMPAQKP